LGIVKSNRDAAAGKLVNIMAGMFSNIAQGVRPLDAMNAPAAGLDS
jgi:hypothetical protein